MKNMKIKYPAAVVEAIKNCPIPSTFPTSVDIYSKIVPSVFIVLDAVTWNKLGFKKNREPEPPFQFRMLNLFQQNYLIEIELHFEHKHNLFLQFDPIHPTMHEYFKLMIKEKNICFIFFNVQTREVLNAFVGLDEEQVEWHKRNYELIKKFRKNDTSELILNRKLTLPSTTSSIIPYFQTSNLGIFMEYSKRYVLFGGA